MSRGHWWWSAVLAATVLVTAACGGASPTAQDPQTSESGAQSGGDALDAVYAEVEGLEGDERRQRLIELAAEEEGTVTWYTSTNLDESQPMVDAYTDAVGLEPELYRASSSDLLQRLIQEAEANYAGADVVASNGPEMNALDQEGLLLPLESPLKDDIIEVARFDNWAGFYLNVFTAAWNTDLLSEDQYPASWEDVLTKYPEQLAMELGDFDWFATLVTHYFVEEQGMSEDEAVELFKEAARNATIVDGHTTMAELMGAGEFSIVASAYQHRIPQLQEDGAPVEWEPAPEPIIVRPNGIGIHRDTDAPAQSLLFVEYLLSDAQGMLAEFDRSPANTTYGSVPEGYETITVDLEAMLNEREKWEGLYDEVVRESGKEVIEE
jgi:iron(III) transport system substrate-binding protein